MSKISISFVVMILRVLKELPSVNDVIKNCLPNKFWHNGQTNKTTRLPWRRDGRRFSFTNVKGADQNLLL